MNIDHESRGDGRVAEPVQVYLAPADQDRLGRLRDTLATTKSDVLRRGLEALETQLSDPDHHPALSIIGLFRGAAAAEDPPHVDAARDHDEVLASGEIASWSSGPGNDPPNEPPDGASE
ncbi:hypothetical protein [Candidatus Palauibacter sp.]|uniref:hypothetical protein n=1 Tax=Candidatus Palauibacter sp. TaxID=3101350 RepID=UPI003B021B9A